MASSAESFSTTKRGTFSRGSVRVAHAARRAVEPELARRADRGRLSCAAATAADPWHFSLRNVTLAFVMAFVLAMVLAAMLRRSYQRL